MNILIVDDSKSIHAYLTDLLGSQNHQVVHAFNGREALSICADQTKKFDVILLDWEMPELTGPETLKQLKATGHPAAVVMMTSRNKPEEIRAMLEAGAVEYVMKPFTDDIILQKLEDASNA